MHPTQSSDAPFLVVVPSTLVLQQPGPGCDEGTCMELCAGMVPMRDVKRPGPSLVYPLRPAGTFWQAHSLGIIDRSSHGCLANRFRRLGELALTILSLAPVQHWRRERRRVDIQSCWERRRKQRIGRHGTLGVDKLPVGVCFDTSNLMARGLLTASPPPHEATAEQEQEHCAAASHEEGQGRFEVVSQEAAL